jgi:hypothetical protein
VLPVISAGHSFRREGAASDCPPERKSFGGPQGPDSNIGSGTLKRWAGALDTLLDRTTLDWFARKEEVSAELELQPPRATGWSYILNCGDHAPISANGDKKKQLEKELKEKEEQKKRRRKRNSSFIAVTLNQNEIL